jgi:hypothetical protein
MNADPKPKPRGRGKAAALLLGVYLMGIVTGVGGGLFVIKQQVRRVLHGSPEAGTPVDFIFAKAETDIADEAGLTPAERAVLHERMLALSREFRGARTRFAAEMREAVRREISTVSGRVEPTRRERVREVIRQRVERWGLERSGPAAATPAPVENL